MRLKESLDQGALAVHAPGECKAAPAMGLGWDFLPKAFRSAIAPQFIGIVTTVRQKDVAALFTGGEFLPRSDSLRRRRRGRGSIGGPKPTKQRTTPTL